MTSPAENAFDLARAEYRAAQAAFRRSRSARNLARLQAAEAALDLAADAMRAEAEAAERAEAAAARLARRAADAAERARATAAQPSLF